MNLIAESFYLSGHPRIVAVLGGRSRYAPYQFIQAEAASRLGFSVVRAQMRVRSWSKLPFLDPRDFLIGLSAVSEMIAASDVPYPIASLRTNGLKRHRESRQCALFCYGMSQFLGVDVRFAPAEESDVDFVAWYQIDSADHFVPLQMKELVPERVKQRASLQEELDKLAKYTDSQDLTVVFHVNRELRIEPAALDFCRAKVAELWLVGYLGDEAQDWLLCGNLLAQEQSEFRFRYPEP